MFGNSTKRQKKIKFKKLEANRVIDSGSDEEEDPYGDESVAASESNFSNGSVPSRGAQSRADGVSVASTNNSSVVDNLSSAQGSAQGSASDYDDISENGDPVNNQDPFDHQVAQGVEQMNGVQPTFYNFDKRIYDHVDEFETSDKKRIDKDLIFIRLVAGGLDKSFVDEDIIKIFKKKRRIRKNNNTPVGRTLFPDNRSVETPVNRLGDNNLYRPLFNPSPNRPRADSGNATEITQALDKRQGREEKSVTTEDQNPQGTYVYYYRYSDQLFNAWSTAIVAVRKMLRERRRISLQTEFEGLIGSDGFLQAFANYVVFLIRKEKLGFIVDRRQTTFEINRDAQDEDRYLYPLMSSLKYDFPNNKLREDLSRSIYGERA